MASLVECYQCFDSVLPDAVRLCPRNSVYLPNKFQLPPSLKLRKTLTTPTSTTYAASKMSSKRDDSQTMFAAAAAALGDSTSARCCYGSFLEKTLPESSVSSTANSSPDKPGGNNSRVSNSACKPQEVPLKMSSLKLTSGAGTPIQRISNPYSRTFSNPGNGVQLLPTPAALPRVRRGSLESKNHSALGSAAIGVPFRTCPSKDERTPFGRQRRHSVESTPFTTSYCLGTPTRSSHDLQRNPNIKSILKSGSRPNSCAPRRLRSVSGSGFARSVSSLGHRETLQEKDVSRAGGSVRSKSPAPRFSYKLDPNLSSDVKRVTFNDDVAVVGSDGVRRRRHSSPSLVLSP